MMSPRSTSATWDSRREPPSSGSSDVSRVLPAPDGGSCQGRNVCGHVDAEPVGPMVRLCLQRQSELAHQSFPLGQYFALDEGVIRSIADWVERDHLLTVWVITFEAKAQPGLVDPFSMLEFVAGLPEILFLDADRSVAMITGEPDVARYLKTSRSYSRTRCRPRSQSSFCGMWRTTSPSEASATALSLTGHTRPYTRDNKSATRCAATAENNSAGVTFGCRRSKRRFKRI
jgi:Domain of unknown function (DUF5753)